MFCASSRHDAECHISLCGGIEVAVGVKGGQLRAYGEKMMARNGGYRVWLHGKARHHELAGFGFKAACMALAWE